jgi:hypothetical protein
MGASGLSLALHGVTGMLVAAGGYQIGEQYMQGWGEGMAGAIVSILILSAAVSTGGRDARRDGYRQGHHDGRNGLFDRTDEIT